MCVCVLFVLVGKYVLCEFDVIVFISAGDVTNTCE